MDYATEVSVVIDQDDAGGYGRAAEYIADRGSDVVLIQHEFGIFGGEDGEYILGLTAGLVRRNVPYVVTLHTVVSEPTAGQFRVLSAICRDASLITVFTESARRLLIESELAPADRVVVVPHGAPAVLRMPVQQNELRPDVNALMVELDHRIVLSTFGLIGPGKGLDVALTALPDVVAHHPDVVYVVAGATHPEVVRQDGEQYRQSLSDMVRALGIEDHVRFFDAFMTDTEVAAVLARTDLYLTPYPSAEQACSGALTFAVTAGCPVVSTAYRYARDLLTGLPGERDPAGMVVPCRNPVALGAAINELLDHPEVLARTRRAADALGAELTWPAVAARVGHVLTTVVRQKAHENFLSEPPQLRHLDRLVDNTGITQFARGSDPDRTSGYCLDDMARLGIVAAGLADTMAANQALVGRWLTSSVDFLAAARGQVGMHNMMSPGGRWTDQPHLGDHVGRAVWAAGIVAGCRAFPRVGERAERLSREVAVLLEELGTPRPVAFAVVGLSALPDRSAATSDLLRTAAARLDRALTDAWSAEWPWWEPQLTYDNARLPQALMTAGAALGREEWVRHGLFTLNWYVEQVGLGGVEPILQCVGNRWRPRPPATEFGSPLSRADEGDEQPVDAAATVEALVTAWKLTRDVRYVFLARRAHAWFHGMNRTGIALFDPWTGGCRDGLQPRAANGNMGAESTLAYFQSFLAIDQVFHIHSTDEWTSRFRPRTAPTGSAEGGPLPSLVGERR